ncbi:MAG: YggS family pyridoxal phosphate-dependent enzyme, partial [Dehalococcoidia bacterium]
MGIAGNAQTVRLRIERAVERAGRSSAAVTVVAVSKGFPPAAIEEALASGIQHIGENRIQEAEPKVRSLAALGQRPTWHMVGHLQTNKVNAAL